MSQIIKNRYSLSLLRNTILLIILIIANLSHSYVTNVKYGNGGTSSVYFTRYKSVPREEWEEFYQGRDVANRNKIPLPQMSVRSGYIPISHYSYQIQHPVTTTKAIESIVTAGFPKERINNAGLVKTTSTSTTPISIPAPTTTVFPLKYRRPVSPVEIDPRRGFFWQQRYHPA